MHVFKPFCATTRNRAPNIEAPSDRPIYQDPVLIFSDTELGFLRKALPSSKTSVSEVVERVFLTPAQQGCAVPQSHVGPNREQELPWEREDREQGDEGTSPSTQLPGKLGSGTGLF